MSHRIINNLPPNRFHIGYLFVVTMLCVAIGQQGSASVAYFVSLPWGGVIALLVTASIFVGRYHPDWSIMRRYFRRWWCVLLGVAIIMTTRHYTDYADPLTLSTALSALVGYAYYYLASSIIWYLGRHATPAQITTYATQPFGVYVITALVNLCVIIPSAITIYRQYDVTPTDIALPFVSLLMMIIPTLALVSGIPQRLVHTPRPDLLSPLWLTIIATICSLSISSYTVIKTNLLAQIGTALLHASLLTSLTLSAPLLLQIDWQSRTYTKKQRRSALIVSLIPYVISYSLLFVSLSSLPTTLLSG